MFYRHYIFWVIVAGNNGSSYAKSTLLAKLSAGGTYTLSLSEGDIEVTVNSINTSVAAFIVANYVPPSSSPSASPTVSAAPSNCLVL